MNLQERDAIYHQRVGAALRIRREKSGKPMREVGEAIGTSLSQVSRYELGENPVPPASLARLAKLYGCTVCDFFEGLKI